MKRIGRLFDEVAGPALEKHGRQQAMLMAHWPEIAGELAAFCRPERLQRPRGRQAAEGMVLRLKVMPGRALEVQHMAPQLMERINAFFGHRLVGRLTFVQAPIATGGRGHGAGPARTAALADPARLERLQAQAERVTDPALAESLKRLAIGVAARAAGKGGRGADGPPDPAG